MLAFRRTFFTTLALAALLTSAIAAVEPVNRSRLGKVAVEGYDVVGYFTESRPVKGDKEITHSWKGAVWRFASAENRDLFAADPERYAPQYGGYCAYAVGNGYTAGIDPEAWTITGDKLYLNYNKKIQERWEADRDRWIEEADRNWPRLLADG